MWVYLTLDYLHTPLIIRIDGLTGDRLRSAGIMSSLLKRRLLNIGDATWFTFQILSHGHPCHLYDVVRRIQYTTYNVQSAAYVVGKGAPVLDSYTAGSVGMRA